MIMDMLERLLSVQVTERIGWTLIHFVWQGAAVALLLAIVLKALHKRSAAVRYVIACLALGLVVVMPVFTLQFIEVSRPTAEAGLVPTAPPAIETLPVEVVEVSELAVEAIDAPLVPIAAPEIYVPWTQRVVTALEPALPYLVFGWLLGVFGLSAWHLGGWAQLQRMRSRMVREVAEPLNAKLAQLAGRLGVCRAVGLLQSALVEVPTVVGWIKPVILLPAGALSGLTTDQLDAILAHELAHIRRYDYLVNILQTVVEILGFYHPGLWWISRTIRDERENCCDDLAVQVTGDSVRYARALTSLEEMRHRGGELAIAAGGGNLLGRVARLLGRPAPRTSRFTWLPGLIALVLATLIVIPTALVLAAPEPTPLDIVEPVPAMWEEADTEEPDRPQIIIGFIIADIFADHVMDRETAEKAQDLLKRKPTGQGRRRGPAITTPSIEELQQPLGQVLSKCFVSEGQAKDFLDLLASQEHVSMVAAPKILQFAGDHGTIATGDMEDPNEPALSLDILPNVNGPENISLIIQFDRRYPTFDKDTEPAVVTKKMALLTKDGQDNLLDIQDTYRDADGNERLCVLLVRPEITFRPEPDQPTEQTNSEALGTATVLAQTEAAKNETPIVTSIILAKVRAETVLDRETIEKVAGALALDRPEARDEIQRLGPNATLSQVLRKCIIGKPLTPQTAETLTAILESGGLLTVEARPSTRSLDNQTTSISLAQEIPVQPGGDPNVSPSYMEVGTFIQVTPHLAPADDLAVVSMKIKRRELIEEHKANHLPGTTTNEIATQAAVPNDRYFSLLMNAKNTSKAQGADKESMLVLFKAQWDRSDASQETAPASEAQPESDHERLVQLRVRVVQVDRDRLDDLGLKLPGPPEKLVPEPASGPAPSLARPSRIGAVVDTQALLAGLDELCEQDQARILSGPNITVRNDQAVEFEIQNEENYYLDPTKDANDSASFVTITSGIKIAATPHIEEDDDVILEVNAEITDVVPRDDPNSLPLVTRHTVRSTAKLQNGDTIVLGGATLKSDSQDEAPSRDTLVLATVRLLDEDEPQAPSDTELPSSVQATMPTSADAPGRRTRAESPAALPWSENRDAVQIQTRFLVLSRELVEALQRGTLIEDANAPEEIVALATLEQRMTPNEWIDVDETVVSTLLKVAQGDRGSRSLAAPRVNVLAGESTWVALTDDVSYTAGYDDADDASSVPVAKTATVSPGLELEITPWLAGNDRITLNGTTTLTNLKGFEDRIYRDEHVYQVPVLDTEKIVIENVLVSNGRTALLLTPSLTFPDPTKEANPDEKSQPLLILIKATKIQVDHSNAGGAAPMGGSLYPDTTGALPPGFGAFAPGPALPKAAGRN